MLVPGPGGINDGVDGGGEVVNTTEAALRVTLAPSCPPAACSATARAPPAERVFTIALVCPIEGALSLSVSCAPTVGSLASSGAAGTPAAAKAVRTLLAGEPNTGASPAAAAAAEACVGRGLTEKETAVAAPACDMRRLAGAAVEEREQDDADTPRSDDSPPTSAAAWTLPQAAPGGRVTRSCALMKKTGLTERVEASGSDEATVAVRALTLRVPSKGARVTVEVTTAAAAP